MASLDVDEYNRAVEATTKAVQQLGLDDDEEGFPALPKLNIGGTEFQTRIDVLRSQPGSLLTAVFMGEEECEYDDKGRFFFDRDPSCFHAILDFMRSGECVIPYERGAFELFRREVEFWRLDVLQARCDIHYKKNIAGGADGKSGGGSGKSSRKLPPGRQVYAKYLAKQKEFHGPLADKLVEIVTNTLMAGCEGGYNAITLTAFRPPETIGVPGLPLFKAPDWVTSTTTYVWDSAYAPFFQPTRGNGLLFATRDFFLTVLEEKGYKATVRFENGFLFYDISASAGEE